MKKRTPRNYEGIKSPSKCISEILPDIIKDIDNSYQVKEIRVIKFWPQAIGAKLSPMTKALSFNNGILTVIVYNSTLYSLLCQHEKERLLKVLRNKFPKLSIQDLIFKVG